MPVWPAGSRASVFMREAAHQRGHLAQLFELVSVFWHGTPPLIQGGSARITLVKEAGVVSQPSAPVSRC